MTKSETYINFIIDQLRNGSISHNEVMTVFVSKFQLSERQFTRYWNKANERYIKELQTIENKKVELHTQKSLELAEGDIISKIETEKMSSYVLSLLYNEITSDPKEFNIKAMRTLLSDIVMFRKTMTYNDIKLNSKLSEEPEIMSEERQQILINKFKQMIIFDEEYAKVE